MVNLVEKLYRGNLDFSLVNFDFKHFEDRSAERNLPKNIIKNLMFHEKMLSYQETSRREKKYKLVYKAPDYLRGYGNIIICVKLFSGCINVMTVYENKQTASRSRRRSLEYPKMSYEFELEEKLLKKAHN